MPSPSSGSPRKDTAETAPKQRATSSWGDWLKESFSPIAKPFLQPKANKADATPIMSSENAKSARRRTDCPVCDEDCNCGWESAQQRARQALISPSAGKIEEQDQSGLDGMSAVLGSSSQAEEAPQLTKEQRLILAPSYARHGFKCFQPAIFRRVPNDYPCVTIACVADSHGSFAPNGVPMADIIVIAGDFTVYGSEEELVKFNLWLRDLPHRTKIVIPGASEERIKIQRLKQMLFHADYCLDAETCTTREGIVFWGARSITRRPGLSGRWSGKASHHEIPPGVDVVVTHSAPWGFGSAPPAPQGCAILAKQISDRKPPLHIFGENHAVGCKAWQGKHTLFLSASLCVGGDVGTRRRVAVGCVYRPYALIEKTAGLRECKFSSKSKGKKTGTRPPTGLSALQQDESSDDAGSDGGIADDTRQVVQQDWSEDHWLLLAAKSDKSLKWVRPK